MSGRHRGSPGDLYVQGASLIHRLDAAWKIAGSTLFVLAVAVTPRRHVVAFAVDAAILAALMIVAHLPLRLVAARLTVIAPFIAFALVIPIVGEGRQIDVGGLSLSVDGLWAMWNIIVKALLGASASILLSSTTTIPSLIVGLTRLRLPTGLIAIVSFMIRSMEIVGQQLQRTRQAITARGHDPRWLWQARPIASSMGALFVRSYERGERVHQAMLARGYRGAMPDLDDQRRSAAVDACALAPALVASAALAVSVVVR